MTPTSPRSTRKVNKTPTEVTPEIKLQEPRHTKKYERNSGKFWIGASIRIVIVACMIIGSFYLGTRVDDSDLPKVLQHTSHEQPSVAVDPMIEHCKEMPTMAGCEKYVSGDTSNSTHDMMDMSMRDMVKMLEGKTGSGLEKAFLEGMIPHHEGAVEMAKYLTGNIHSELYKMKNDIITAQTKEIEQMKKWLEDWGYSSGTTDTGTVTPAERIAL